MLCLKSNNNKAKRKKTKILDRFHLSIVFGENDKKVTHAWVFRVVYINNIS